MKATELRLCACVVFLVLLALLTAQHSQASRSSANPRSRSNARSRSNSRPTRRRGNTAVQTQFTCKDRATFRVTYDDLRSRPFTTRCPRAPVVDLKALAVRGDCTGTTTGLKASALGCEWNATCAFKFSANDQRMRSVDPRDFYQCSDQPPAHYEIQYTCLKKKVDVKNVLGEFQRTNKKAGVAKSHTLYPWSYRNGVELGNLTFVKPRRPTSLSTLWFTVRSYAIKSSDLLFLTWEDNSNPRQSVQAVRVITPANGTFDLPNVSRVTLTFYADYTQHRTQIDGPENGFVLCYQWLPRTKRPKKGSACTRVLQPAKCRSSSGRGASRSSRGRNRNSNNRRSRNNRQQ